MTYRRIGRTGPNIAQAIVDWFSRERNQSVLRKLQAAGVWPIEQGSGRAGRRPLVGMTFVATGTLAGFSRDEVKAYIESHAGKLTDSVGQEHQLPGARRSAGAEVGEGEGIGGKSNWRR